MYSLAYARKHHKSVCLDGAGPNYAVIGSNANNTIGLSGARQRVLGLGGNDAITVKSGNSTCVDGGSGNDTVKAGKAPVRVYGGAGNDKVRAITFSTAGQDVIKAATAKTASTVVPATTRSRPATALITSMAMPGPTSWPGHGPRPPVRGRRQRHLTARPTSTAARAATLRTCGARWRASLANTAPRPCTSSSRFSPRKHLALVGSMPAGALWHPERESSARPGSHRRVWRRTTARSP